MRLSLSLFAFYLLIVPVNAAEKAAAPDLNANAALKYWQAFSSLPKLTEEQTKVLEADKPGDPVTDQLKKIVADSEDALREMHHAAKISACAWGISFEDGFGARLNHCVGARMLARVACARIRMRLEQDRPPHAVEDAIAVVTMGRQVSRDGSIIAVLVGFAVEVSAIDTLAAQAAKLDKPALRALAERWDRLPTTGTIASALAFAETKFGLGWFVDRIRAMKDRNQLEEFLTKYVESPEQRKQLLDKTADNPQALVKFAEEVQAVYAEAGKKLSLPPDEFDKMWGAQVRSLKENPVAAVLMPALSKCRRAEARMQAKRAMWKAVLAIQTDGTDVRKAHRDPFGDGPFEYTPFDGGYELRSKLKMHDDKPVVLIVGRSEKK